MKLLFVCTANIDRSPTGEDIFRGKPGIEVKSAGTEEAYATVPISRSLIEWADIVFCMERHHRDKVIRMSPNAASKAVVLDIPDYYYRGDLELVKLIKAKASKYIKELKLEDD